MPSRQSTRPPSPSPFPVPTGKWQATNWPGSISRISGSSVAHTSPARGHRVRNRQPDGGMIGDGGSPAIVVAARGSTDGSIAGIELIRISV